MAGLTIRVFTLIPERTPLAWILPATMVVLVAIGQALPLRTSSGEITFLPVISMTALLALGYQDSLWTIMLGTLIGRSVHFVRQWRASQSNPQPLWERASVLLWPGAQAGLSILAAQSAYLTLGQQTPLTDITRAVLPVIVSTVMYLLVYNLLLLVDQWLAGEKAVQNFIANRTVILGTQWLPAALAPFSAVAFAGLGEWAFFLFEIILLTVVLVIYFLMASQYSLARQVQQLNAFSGMNRALRTTLQIEGLLEMVYFQTANILQIRNLHVVLRGDDGADDDIQSQDWKLALAIENRHRVTRDTPYRLDHLARQVLADRQPVLADPTQGEPGTPPPPGRSWMGVPLQASGKLLGMMYTWLEGHEQVDRTFLQPDLDMFSAVAAQMSVALENAQLYEAARKHATQLARLNKISAMMSASLNPEKVLEMVAQSVIEVSGCDKASIYLMQQESKEPTLVLAHAEGFSPEHIARSRDIAVPMTSIERKEVIEEGRPVMVTDIHQAGAQVSPVALLLAQREKFIAYAYIPLQAQLQPIGMLAVYYEKPHQFPGNEIEVLSTFANQAALSVTNARIYHRVDIQLAQRMEQIMRMSDINQRLSSTLDMPTIFNLIIDSAMDGCSADAGVLVLTGDLESTQKSGELNMVAWRGFDPAKSTRMPHQVAESLATKVFATGETIIRSDDDPDIAGPRSQLCVPIMLDGKVIGALALESERLMAFTDDDLTFVNQLAVQAAVAIRNSQLYTHSQLVRDRLHAILDSSNDGLVMLDPKARIVMTNTRMGDFWDFARSNIGPAKPEDFQSDPLSILGEGLGYARGGLSGLLGRGIRNPNIETVTDVYQVRAGESQRQRFVERTSTAVRDEGGSFVGLLLIFRDITEQKELEAAREDLTRLIVHDLRAPLQTVMGSMRLIDSMVPDKPREVEQATHLSERAVQKLLNLVNDLLDISSMENGEIKLHTSIESVKTILEDVVKSMITLSEEAEAEVRLEDLPAALFADIDRDMIERVVINLLDNALKHTREGTIVRLRAEVKPADSPTDKDMILVQVIDNGPGVPDEFKQKIFERFTQVPGQDARRRSTGLGLAFVSLAVGRHNGKVWVEDNPGGGSIFAFTLPAAGVSQKLKPEPKAAQAKKVDGKDGSGKSQAEPDTSEKKPPEAKVESKK
jgi:K+-sensing histidine kinase KdpD